MNEKLEAKERDVWAFGMTAHELLSGNILYAELKYNPQVVLALGHGQLPACPSTFSGWPGNKKFLWTVCLVCWDMEPALQPTMRDSELIGTLEVIMRDYSSSVDHQLHEQRAF
ncbi:hypothetical protein ACEPAI_2160 [Sanghuangporus weigelae]